VSRQEAAALAAVRAHLEPARPPADAAKISALSANA
jgi:hypothetical protein